jgi:putative aldouronate transport system permease protein
MAGKGSLEGESTLKVEQIGIVADLFNSIIAMFLVLGSNAISRRVSNTSLF